VLRSWPVWKTQLLVLVARLLAEVLALLVELPSRLVELLASTMP
jgi:hypothetical protein